MFRVAGSSCGTVLCSPASNHLGFVVSRGRQGLGCGWVRVWKFDVD